ncbi:MAG: hypothetical protein QXQ46_04125 [Thermoplasmatales archaeon]
MEEEKISEETRKIFGSLKDKEILYADMKIFHTATRDPIRIGHFGSVVVKLRS